MRRPASRGAVRRADLGGRGAGRDLADGGPGFDVCRSAEQRRGSEEMRPASTKGPQPVGGYCVDAFAERAAPVLVSIRFGAS